MKSLFQVVYTCLLALPIVEVRADLISNGSFEAGDFAAPGDPAFQAFTSRLFATLLQPGSQRMSDWEVFLSPFDPDGQMTHGLPTAIGLEWAHTLDGSIDGFRNLDLNRGGDLFGIKQSVALQIGREYSLSYFALTGSSLEGPLHGAPLRIELNGSVLAVDQTPASPTNYWLKYTHNFIATANATEIAFMSAGRGADPGTAPVIDRITLVAVPEVGCTSPACIIAMCFLMRRKNRIAQKTITAN